MTTIAGPSSNDDPLVAKAVSAVYTPPPFCYYDLSFSNLPQSTQEFLTHTTNRCPQFLESCGPADFDEIPHVRNSRAARLERVLEGVHRAIATKMVALDKPTTDVGSRNVANAELQGVLIPEWWRHLNDYVDEIDALVWLNIHARKDTSNPLSLDQALDVRAQKVAQLIKFVLQLLQMAYVRQREARGQAVMTSIMDSMGDELDGVWGSITQQDCAGDSGLVLESPN